MTQSMQFEEPEEFGGGERVNPRDVLGHLLLVWAIEYIEHSPTQYSKPGKPSDVIIVDMVDLSIEDPETGQPGYLARRQWWRQGKIIGTLKSKVGRPLPMLATMSTGVGNPGFAAPFVLVSQSGDPNAVELANQWFKNNPDFVPSEPRPRWDGGQQQQQQNPWTQNQSQGYTQPQVQTYNQASQPSTVKRWEQAPPTPPTAQQTESLMDRLKRQAEQKRAGQLPPPSPPDPGPPPF